MASSSNSPGETKKFKGVRQRKWGKWVSEIRIPGSQDRLWLGSYSSPEAAAVAHDVAYYCLRRPSNLDHLNFPPMVLPLTNHLLIRDDMSPGSIQRAASDAAMAVDAQYICNSLGDRGSSGRAGAFQASGDEQYSGLNNDQDLSIQDYL
ncbi:ethylene-responsive transcription factor ERF020 [Cucumis sativus]|uniref:AP2/ERF domain-containing protein n=1 Tax=Cucumis sativus TaxID=3659 RepID=A0A0A0LPY2_CUCSA|nr:ethylene-responsive transcription factor ERF020 [Cucumis sativus]